MFCRGCLAKWFDQEKADCPVCRTIVAVGGGNGGEGELLDVPSFLKEAIDALDLSCKNEGCNFSGKLQGKKRIHP